MRAAGSSIGTRHLLVYVAGIEWHGIKGTDRHLVERLAQTVDVLWVDPPVSVLRTVRRRAGEGPRLRRTLEPVAEGITRLSLVVQPFPARPVSRTLSGWLLRRSLRWAVRQLGREAYAIVNSRPEPVIGSLPHAVHVYFATDDFTAGAELLGLSARRLQWVEKRQVCAADVLVGVTERIAARWLNTDKEILILPNGCDAATFADIDRLERPSDVQIRGPMAGVVGQFSARTDLALLEATAERGIPLLLVGPVDPGFESARFAALVARPEVCWVGRQPFDRIPNYLASIKVGLTPYADTPFNRASFPLKTLEYLAAGRAVVSTALPAVEELGCHHVFTASGPADFASAVERLVLTETTRADAEERRAFAREHDWSVRAATLLGAIERARVKQGAR